MTVALTCCRCLLCISFADLARCFALVRRDFLGIILTLMEMKAAYKFWYLKYRHALKLAGQNEGQPHFESYVQRNCGAKYAV